MKPRSIASRRLAHLLLVACTIAWSTPMRSAEENPKLPFHIPADKAENSLKVFSRQSGCGVIFVTGLVQGVWTNAVQGEFTPEEAIDRMLDGTGLVATKDEQTGAFAVRRRQDPARTDGPAESPAPVSPDLPPPANQPAAMGGEVINMSPFEVQTTSDQGYSALNSNSITAFNTELARLPVSADIFDQTFMEDTAATSVEALIAGNSAGAGFQGPDPASTAASNQPGDRVSDGFIQLRGLTTGAAKRDSLLPVGALSEPGSTGVGFTSPFDIEQVEIINGPQALLYGSGGAGGVINLVSKQARIGEPTFGSMTYQLDQYGSKMALFDYGASTGDVAVRLAVLNQSIDTARINIGGPVEGYYLQVAANAFKNTTIRVEAEQTTYNHIKPDAGSGADGIILNAGSSAVDARNGDYLTYLLATNQVSAPATGPAGAGTIDNGYLNWSNVYSYEGWFSDELTVDNFELLTADTVWTRWLSTKLSVGASDWEDDYYLNNTALYSPTATSNPVPGQWTYSEDGSEPEHDSVQGDRTKSVQFMALATNDFFGGRAHSQSILGADFTRTDSYALTYGLYEADSNWNLIVNPAVTTLKSEGDTGYTPIPHLDWSVNQGPILYPFFPPNATRVVLNGVNYIRVLSNPVQPQLISPNDPLGVTLGGDTADSGRVIEKGLFGTNYTQWLNGKLDTLLGFRLENEFYENFSEGSAPPAAAGATAFSEESELNFNVGADYRLTDWLRPYFSVSSSFDRPNLIDLDVYGDQPGLSHAIGQEAGFKFQDPAGRLSGSLAYYHVNSENEQLEIISTLLNDINPSGLNGHYGADAAVIPINRQSEGVQLTLTSAPTDQWRIRLSAAWVDGTVATNASFAQLYNDQFYENSQGQVTYADGTVVYVPATFNSKTLTEPSTTAGAVPLTVALLSSPTSSYYANPGLANGQISSSSNAAKVLEDASSVHGPILTGAVGLPISDLQIDPAASNITIPGQIVVSQAGDATTGYPEVSLSFTSVYTFGSGWAKGIELGGTANLGWLYRDFYYYPDDYTNASSPRSLFYLPDVSNFNLIAGYTHKFRRITWHLQANVSNVFNHYSVILIPGEITGWSTPAGVQATLSQQPRAYQLTNKISF